ncbi:winged helix-turn-helix transcriptional regulator [Streptomyces sp. NPDC051018]|uniref:winged helix-turn-helix transcriptional regulator n=1 Tax=Streptomyces sp. NPDC051018 TaxID=3365639 RepID=UPI0037A562D0
MASTGLSPAVRTDLARVTESLSMLTPRWNVQLLLVLSDKPLRYTEIKQRMPWLADGQLHPKLRQLTDTGLVARTEHGVRHVTYGLTSRGTDLIPVLTAIATWADTHLEKEPVSASGSEAFRRARDVEDTLVLIAARHATPILWTLQVCGTATVTTVAGEAMPGYGLSSVYPKLRQLVADGLVDVADGTSSYQLTASGRALAPVYGAITAWAAGRPLAEAAAHPLWGQPPAPSQQSGTWASTQTRLSAPAIPTTWRAGELFSHKLPARALAGAPAGGPRR